ncbi:probable disease resistance protein At1g59620 isoform X2 [Salvia splendens]|uniref:probable disease resistance protein At1g59620 isoform X2 n=1 Tax=Salvia splendens TaxID=180675 RepID=UPI001C279284|nr:probable disease resistance protein At1g59620 isoform X2 [Salvia splendens]
MVEAVILSLMQKLNKYQEERTDKARKYEIEQMERIIKEDALYLYKHRKTHVIEYNYNWIGEIKMRMLKLGADGAETESNSENVDEHHVVVGLDKHIEMVLRTMIFHETEYRSWVVIKGMSGIGKTTLAREIYNHADVIDRFKYRAWVCVSNVFTLKEIFIKLLLQVVVDGENLHTSSSLEEMDNQTLLYMLHQHLQGLPYLIVLDDLPKQIPLEPLWEALEQQEYGGSKLVVTSHMTHQFIKTRWHDVHKMEPLDPIMSWQLFYKTINSGNKLRSEQKFPKELEYQGKLMLRKCGGLPLAIKEVANQLARKKASTGTEWEHLLESVDFGSTLELLEPYYQKLDPKLLPYFMCMALFKENTTLRANKLLQIWNVAGGSYYSHSYLDGLVNESVIDEVQGKRTRYCMNPVLHRLSIKKAEEGIGFEILGSTRLNRNPRHRVIICSRDNNFSYSTNQDEYLVSLFFHGGGYFNASPSYWKGFEKLKIIDLEDFGLKILPEAIGTLTKLRYLGLRNNYIKELPKSVGCLEKLEVLDIAQNFMVQVPDILWEMGSLFHVYMSDVISEKPFTIDVLQRLKTLTSVSFDDLIYDDHDELLGLTSLEKLSVHDLDGNTTVSKLFGLLSNLGYLFHLVLRGYRFRSMPCLDELGSLQNLRTLKLDGRLDRLPNSFPYMLTSLTLANSCLNKDPMSLLGKLTKLHTLILRNAYTGQQMGIPKFGFKALKVLCIENLLNLRNLQIGKGALELLRKLEIRNCPCLDTLPKELQSNPVSLGEFEMVTTKTISTKIRNSSSISKIRFVNINP